LLIKTGKLASDNFIINKDKLRYKLESGRNYGIEYKKECIDCIESGFNDYMQEVIKDVVSVFQMTCDNDDFFKDKKKTFDFYEEGELAHKGDKPNDYYWVDSGRPMEDFSKNLQGSVRSDREYQRQIDGQQFAAPTGRPSLATTESIFLQKNFLDELLP
jgi:hypothetical protein